MRPNIRRQEAPSSLEDSSYELLNDGSVESDDGQTESLASIDGHTPDDMSSVADTEDSDDDSFVYEAPEPRSNPITSSTAPPFGYTSAIDAASSLTTTVDDTRPQIPLSVDFVESEWRSEEDDVPSAHLLQSFQAPNMPDVLQQYGFPEIRVTFKQTLSKTYLPPKRPFRVLFAGEPTDYMKEEAVKKIASALAAGRNSISDSSSSSQQSSSRFSVIRTPTGFGYSTHLQLIDSTDIELIIDQCVGASRHGTGFSSMILLSLSDGTNLEFRACNFDRGSWMGNVPDIAVFCHPEAPAYQLSHSLEELGKHQLVREALESQSIPILDISAAVPFRQCPDTYTYGSKSLRVCVEGRASGEIEFRVLETLPININSFLDINPGQLNRHMAYIIQSGSGVLSAANTTASRRAAGSPPTKPGLRSAVKDWLSNVEISGKTRCREGFKSFATNTWQNRRLHGPLVAALILMLAMSTALFTRGLYEKGYMGQTQHDVSSSIKSLSESISKWNQAPVTGPPQIPVAAVQTPSCQSPGGLSIGNLENSVGLPFAYNPPPMFNGSGEFKIHIIGDRHFVLTPPQQFLKLKKPPKLLVRVARAGNPVPSSISKLVQGVFAVELEHQHANGLLNVTIWTESKPLVKQNFTVSFGSPWLKLSAWANSAEKLSETVKSDVALAQTGLKVVSNSVVNGLRNGRLTVEHGTTALIKQTTFWTNKAKRSSQSVSDHLQQAQREAAQRVTTGYQASKDISRSIHRGCQASAKIPARLWQATRPVRTSKSLLKARQNSRKLWRKLGLPGLPKEDPNVRIIGRKPCKNCRR